MVGSQQLGWPPMGGALRLKKGSDHNPLGPPRASAREDAAGAVRDAATPPRGEGDPSPSKKNHRPQIKHRLFLKHKIKTLYLENIFPLCPYCSEYFLWSPLTTGNPIEGFQTAKNTSSFEFEEERVLSSKGARGLIFRF